MREMRKQICQASADKFTRVARYLQVFQNLNPGATVALQDDDDNSFHLLFISVPNGAQIFTNSCLPLFYADGGGVLKDS